MRGLHLLPNMMMLESVNLRRTTTGQNQGVMMALKNHQTDLIIFFYMSFFVNFNTIDYVILQGYSTFIIRYRGNCITRHAWNGHVHLEGVVSDRGTAKIFCQVE